MPNSPKRWPAVEPRPLLLRGGDVHAALGAPTGAAPGDGGKVTATRLALDVLRVEADGFGGLAVAHVVARGRGRLGRWRGPLAAIMNVDHIGRWDVAPRAHPGDGRLDVVEVAASMGWRARWQARRRLPTGTHVPHPDITVRRLARIELAFDQPREIVVDGVRRGTARRVTVTVEPDAATVYV